MLIPYDKAHGRVFAQMSNSAPVGEHRADGE
jgi:hypothetical protein